MLTLTSVLSPRIRTALWWISGPLLIGLWSLWRGQDVNWDTLNYHRSKGHAVLTGRLFEDLLPAGLQSSFHPGLDVLYAWLEAHLGARGLGFFHGTWQGLALPMIGWLAYQTLGQPDISKRVVHRCAWAGVLSACFWAEVGTTFGDATTVVALLAATLCVWQGTATGKLRWWWVAGLCAGLAIGFKLTNLPGVIGLGAAIVVLAWRHRRPGAVVAYTLGTTLTFALVAGPWMYVLWREYGNPLFPQLAHIFPHPWLLPVSVVDMRFLPRHWWEALTWPAWISLRPMRVSEEFFLQILWLPAYGLACLLLLRAIWRRLKKQAPSGRPPWSDGEILVGVTLTCSFVVWMAMFSIYRYLVFAELLLPLALFMMWRRWSDSVRAMTWWRRLTFFSMVVAVCGGTANWGHSGWTEPAARSDLPPQALAASAVVAFTGNGWSWLMPLFEPDTRFVGMGLALPTSPTYALEVRRRLAQAPVAYAVVGLRTNWRRDVVARANRVLGHAGMLSYATTCEWLASVVKRGVHAGLSSNADGCRLTDLPSDEADNQRRNAHTVQQAVALLEAHGQVLEPAECQPQRAWLGDKQFDFLLCPLKAKPSP